MEERMEIFMDSMEQSAIAGSSGATNSTQVSDDEIDRMISGGRNGGRESRTVVNWMRWNRKLRKNWGLRSRRIEDQAVCCFFGARTMGSALG